MRPIEATARPVSAAASAARTVRPSAGAEPDQIEIAAGRFLLRPLRAASWGLKGLLRGKKPVQAAPAHADHRQCLGAQW